MGINELQKALAIVKKIDLNATVTSYYTDYIAIWVNDIQKLSSKVERQLKDMGWQPVAYDGDIYGWYK